MGSWETTTCFINPRPQASGFMRVYPFSASAENLQPVPDMLLAAVRGVRFPEKDKLRPKDGSCILRPSCCLTETARRFQVLSTMQRVCIGLASATSQPRNRRSNRQNWF